jgi:transcription-repair coupling factor (superfamily II helicase)
VIERRSRNSHNCTRLSPLCAQGQQSCGAENLVVCQTVHSQESFYETMLNWEPDALFLPEAELAAVENVLPDPEIAAERLELLMQVDRETDYASS